MKELLDGKIMPAITHYSAAADKSPLNQKIKLMFGVQFKIITSALKRFDTAAKQKCDAELAALQASGKVPPPIVVLKQPDLLKLAVAKMGGLKNITDIGVFPLELVINDKEILTQFRDEKNYPNQAEAIRNAADFSKLVAEIAKAVKDADENVGKGKDTNAEKKLLHEKIEHAVHECAVRATDEAGHQAKLSGKVTWINIKSGLNLTLNALGVAAGATAIGLAPITFGMSSIAGFLGLSKSVVGLCTQIKMLGSDVNTLAASAATEIKDMKKGYDQWLGLLDKNKVNPKSLEIGISEFGKRGMNALLPTWVTTIKSVKDKIKSCDDKCHEIQNNANNLGEQLEKLLNAQEKAKAAVDKFMKESTGSYTREEYDKLTSLFKKLIDNEKATDSLIKDIIALNEKASVARVTIGKLSNDLQPIDDANPTWSKVSSALFETTASVGYMFLASSGAPEPFDFAKEIAHINEDAKKSVEILKTTIELGEGLEDAFKKKAKH
jgi:hypothetical protein